MIELIRIFEKERPGVPMRVDHGRMMLDDAGKGYNPGYFVSWPYDGLGSDRRHDGGYQRGIKLKS